MPNNAFDSLLIADQIKSIEKLISDKKFEKAKTQLKKIRKEYPEEKTHWDSLAKK